MIGISRERSAWSRVRRRTAVLAIAMVAASSAVPAQAQDLVHRFIDPSFGGNPFYSDHLLAIANIDRPKEKTTATPTPTDEELLAEQLRARLLSQLQGNILDSIQNAKVGDSGTFNFGNQTVSYTRTGTETRITFTNTTTGETNTVVIPASTTPVPGTTGAVTSAEASRAAAAASSTNIAVTGSLTGITVSPTGQSSAAGVGTSRQSAEQALGASGSIPTGSGNAGSVLPPF